MIWAMAQRNLDKLSVVTCMPKSHQFRGGGGGGAS
jgi:hypothetical protein